MITRWLASTAREPNPYGFAVVDICDTNAVEKNQLTDYLSDCLVEGLVAPERLEEILRKAGLDKVCDLLRDRVVERKIPVLIADFGEIVAAQMLHQFDDYLIPIAKLRFREKRNWSMRLTDVLGIKHDGKQLNELCLCEVKTRTSWKKECEEVGLAGYKALENDEAQRIPEIVEFVADKLRLMQDYELAGLMDTFLLSDNPAAFPRVCILVLLFDSAIWNESVLAGINSAPVKVDHFLAKVIRITQLRDLIDNSYSRVLAKRNGSSTVSSAD